MALKAVLDSLDGVDESVAQFYEQGDDGKFRLALDGVESHPAVLGLVENRNKVLDERKKLADQLKRLEGIDPDEYTELKKQFAEQEQRKLEQKGEWEKLREQMQKKHEEDVAKLNAQRENVMQKLRKVLVDNEATKVITSEDFKGNPTLLLPHIRDRVRVDESGDDFNVIVLQADGQTPLIADASGSPASIKDLISEMREDPSFGQAFAASGATGTGSQNRGGQPSPLSPGRLAKGDDDGFIANLEEIAAGKVQVDMPNPVK